MSLPATLPQAILDTILNRLALLFLSGAAGDLTVARQAARQILADHNPETSYELSLAAEIISLQLHSLEALSYASDPDLSLNKILRFRGSAVSLSREQHKAHRKLDQIQRARRAGTQPQVSEPTPASPKIEKAIAVIEAQRPAAAAAAPKTQAKRPSPQSFHKREAARLITENLKKKQAEYVSQTAAIAASAPPPVSNAAGTHL